MMKSNGLHFMLYIFPVFFVLQTAGAQWVQIDKLQDMPGSGSIEYMVGNDNTLLAETMVGEVYFSADNGESWTPVYSISSGSVTALAVCEDTLFIATSADGVVLSTDNGGNWNAINQGLPHNATVNSITVSSGCVFAAVGTGVYRATCTGPRWTPVDSSFNNGIVSLAASEGTIFAATAGGDLVDVHFSSDSGSNWITVDSSIRMNNDIVKLAVSGENIFVAGYGGVFHSTLNGTGWFTSDAGIGTLRRPVEALAVYGSTVFAVFEDYGLYNSSVNGRSWILTEGFPESLPKPHIHSLAVCGEYLFAGSFVGEVWRRPLSEMVETVRTTPQREKHNKSQLQINPVNRTGDDIPIAFTLPRAQRVAAAMFDINGREVSSPVHSNLTADSYRFVCNTSGLTPGSYMVRLQAGARTYTKRVQIVH